MEISFTKTEEPLAKVGGSQTVIVNEKVYYYGEEIPYIRWKDSDSTENEVWNAKITAISDRRQNNVQFDAKDVNGNIVRVDINMDDVISCEQTITSKNNETPTYYAVTQFNNGAEHKWIFDEMTVMQALSEHGIKSPEGIEAESIDCFWPISGSNCSSTFFMKMDSLEEIKEFLIAPGQGPDSLDPTLVDLAEYYCAIDTYDTWSYDVSSTEKFVKKFGLNPDNLETGDSRYDDAKKMITVLKELGYKDFDYENPFYGNNSDTTYDELYSLYKEQIIKNIPQVSVEDIQMDSFSVNSHYAKDGGAIYVLACYTTKDGNYMAYSGMKRNEAYYKNGWALDAQTFREDPEIQLCWHGTTSRLLDADSCNPDIGLDRWSLNNERISAYEAYCPRKDILELAQKDKLSVEDINTIKKYYNKVHYDFIRIPNGPKLSETDSYHGLTVREIIKDGFTKDRIALIGKENNVATILKMPDVERFYTMHQAQAKTGNSTGHKH